MPLSCLRFSLFSIRCSPIDLWPGCAVAWFWSIADSSIEFLSTVPLPSSRRQSAISTSFPNDQFVPARR